MIMTRTNIIAVSDGWDIVPQEKQETSGLIRGTIARFREREYVLDKLHNITGNRYGLTGVSVLWVQWRGGKPQEHRITQPGQQHPYREDLPDQDRALWEAGLSGEPADP